MQNNIRNTNLRFNLDKEQQRRAWEYLQTMDRQDFKSYSRSAVIFLRCYKLCIVTQHLGHCLLENFFSICICQNFPYRGISGIYLWNVRY